MNLRYGAALLLLGAIWGSSFIFIRITAPALGPLFLMDMRVLLAGAILLILAVLIGERPRILHRWRNFLIMGLLNAALPFTLIAFSQLTLTASLASILNATTPLFTAVVAAIWMNEQLNARRLAGIFMGIVGVAVLVGGSPLALTPDKLLAAAASLGAALCYGLGNVYATKQVKGVRTLDASIGQLFGAGVILLVPAVFAVPTEPPSPDVLGALFMLIVVCTSLAYLLYFFLLKGIGPTRASTVTFLVPVFGTIWGVIFLQEPLSVGMIAGMIIILASVSLVTGHRFRWRKPVPASV